MISRPVSLPLRPLEAADFNGSYQLLFGGDQFAVGRWDAALGLWVFPSGAAFDLAVTHIHAPEASA